jgi:hypothetical protein
MCRFINPNLQFSYVLLLLIIGISDYPGKSIYRPHWIIESLVIIVPIFMSRGHAVA